MTFRKIKLNQRSSYILLIIAAIAVLALASFIFIRKDNPAGVLSASTSGTFSGTLEVEHTHFEDRNTSKTTYTLVTDQGEKLELNFKNPNMEIDHPTAKTGTKVTVKGVKEAGHISVDTLSSPDDINFESTANGGQVLGSVSAKEPDLPPTQMIGTRKMAFVLFNFTTDTRTPTTIETIRTSRQDLHDYFYEQSYGQLNLVSTDADVYGTYTISKPATCDGTAFAGTVKQKAVSAGVNLSQYQHVIYIMPLDTAYCAFGSGTNIGADWVIVNGNRYMGARVIAHELGHNLGLDHASGVRCRAYNTSVQNPLGGLTDCDWQEYYDPFDSMNGYYDLN